MRSLRALVPVTLGVVSLYAVPMTAQRGASPDIPAAAQNKSQPAEQAEPTQKASPGQKPDSGQKLDSLPGGGPGGGRRRGIGAGAEGDAAKPDKNAYDYYLPGPDGKDIPLASYKGKYILVVNLGRKSTYGAQLPALIKFNDTYKDKGFVVIGVPSNEFGAAEPGTNAEIQKAYADAKADFPIVGLSKLTGDDELPFFQYLTTSKSAPPGGGVAWNYTKFVIDKKGNVLARLDPDVAPDSPEMLATIDQILDGTYKPKRPAPAGGRSGGGGGGGEAGPPN